MAASRYEDAQSDDDVGTPDRVFVTVERGLLNSEPLAPKKSEETASSPAKHLLPPIISSSNRLLINSVAMMTLGANPLVAIPVATLGAACNFWVAYNFISKSAAGGRQIGPDTDLEAGNGQLLLQPTDRWDELRAAATLIASLSEGGTFAFGTFVGTAGMPSLLRYIAAAIAFKFRQGATMQADGQKVFIESGKQFGDTVAGKIGNATQDLRWLVDFNALIREGLPNFEAALHSTAVARVLSKGINSKVIIAALASLAGSGEWYSQQGYNRSIIQHTQQREAERAKASALAQKMGSDDPDPVAQHKEMNADPAPAPTSCLWARRVIQGIQESRCASCGRSCANACGNFFTVVSVRNLINLILTCYNKSIGNIVNGTIVCDALGVVFPPAIFQAISKIIGNFCIGFVAGEEFVKLLPEICRKLNINEEKCDISSAGTTISCVVGAISLLAGISQYLAAYDKRLEQTSIGVKAELEKTYRPGTNLTSMSCSAIAERARGYSSSVSTYFCRTLPGCIGIGCARMFCCCRANQNDSKHVAKTTAPLLPPPSVIIAASTPSAAASDLDYPIAISNDVNDFQNRRQRLLDAVDGISSPSASRSFSLTITPSTAVSASAGAAASVSDGINQQRPYQLSSTLAMRGPAPTFDS